MFAKTFKEINEELLKLEDKVAIEEEVIANLSVKAAILAERIAREKAGGSGIERPTSPGLGPLWRALDGELRTLRPIIYGKQVTLKRNRALVHRLALKRQSLQTAAKPLDIPPHDYALRLSELSGLPRGLPLSALMAPRVGMARCGRSWRWRPCALSNPKRALKYGELLKAANASLAKQKKAPIVTRIATRLPTFFKQTPPPRAKARLIRTIQDEWHFAHTKQRKTLPLPGARLDTHLILRALAIAPARYRRTFMDAPWLPHAPPAQASSAGLAWLAPAAALVPLLLALIWLANALAFRKAYLRRRPPQLPPLHLDLVSEARMRLAKGANLYRQVAQRLQIRTPKPTSRLDPRETVAATIAAGGQNAGAKNAWRTATCRNIWCW